jgi:pre-mRNA-splicing factor RBM22/SLT11
MQKFSMSGSCHISSRPYTVYRWKAGCDARYKKTVICPEIARLKNVCQVCMLDLEYNLPVQVRDHALNLQTEILPISDAGKEFAINQLEAYSESDARSIKFSEGHENHLLMKLARTEPFYKRNQARVCSFFAKGSCNRGIECPYRHESSTNDEPSNYHDRYYGVNDPVAQKLLSLAANIPSLSPPSDPCVSTIFVGNITPSIRNEDVQEKFNKYGEIESIKMVYIKNCAYVTYSHRTSAEEAILNLGKRIVINAQPLTLRWSKPHALRTSKEKPSASMSLTGGQMFDEIKQSMGFMSGPQFFNASTYEENTGKLYRTMNPEQFGSHNYKEDRFPKSKAKLDGTLTISKDSLSQNAQFGKFQSLISIINVSNEKRKT